MFERVIVKLFASGIVAAIIVSILLSGWLVTMGVGEWGYFMAFAVLLVIVYAFISIPGHG